VELDVLVAVSLRVRKNGSWDKLKTSVELSA
jgi:hypothetical protein